ncbi:DUF4116 domain-containing protein [Endozoicomonas sp. 8E]|uniref:DUF4116 domain-containing protein n=1 Tax=Endozoicomonas sp. 8E TaxID=3035692 RepID=UPI002938FB73|nr:DUF4116 domain-containing protein [Endozoicomonas sp. 8E]WOG25645.1 DUF4116 domain-containing protein [Endozoicomonas sp. 8E]
MLNVNSDKSNDGLLTAYSSQNNRAGSPSRGTDSSPKRHLGDSDSSGVSIGETPLAKRLCRLSVSDQTPPKREELGGKGMFLWRMKKAGLTVPSFECVTARIMNALEQHSLDTGLLARYLPMIEYELEAGKEISLTNIRACLNAMPPSKQTKRNNWLAGLAEFIASEDYYQQVKDSEAARKIRGLHSQVGGLSASQPMIVRSSGINEDNYGDAQAGKYLSLVQGEEDILRTCLKVMASAYRPEVCSEGIPQPMALIIQQCIDCRYGGVAMSFQSFQNNTLRAEFTSGQPRGVVAGQTGNTPHRIDIYRKDRKEEAVSYQYFPGTISSHFVLHKNDNGYSETIIDNVDAQSYDGGLQLTDTTVSELMEAVIKLENLLLCPVDVEFAVDHQGRLFLLQVRPVTRLAGDMVFAMPIPAETLAIGESVSEGYCTGPLWRAEKREKDGMPQGAIVVAHHAEDWMLEPEFLKQMGGFVFARAGFNDHVAILMKQQRITLMRTNDQSPVFAAENGQQTTLACGRFKGKPGAFIVAGDMTDKLVSHRSLASVFSDVPCASAIPSREDLSIPEGKFCHVASGFKWLTDQNARLLAFFASGGGLDCLANPVKLSMSPDRSKQLAETRDSVKRLIHGTEALLAGYRAFLRLARKSRPHLTRSLRDELPQLSKGFKTLKQTILSGLDSITLPIQAAEEGHVSPGILSQWVADCHQLQSCLQALDPVQAEQVRSVHELIFALHRRFVEALAPVTLASVQGKVSTNKNITYFDFTTPGEESSLLGLSGKASMDGLRLSGTVISMDEAVIVNLELGCHVGLIELLENADGGKGRTLRLKFSDQFNTPDGVGKTGKFNRVWFLVQLLKAIELNKDADSMHVNGNAVAGEITVECTGIASRETMQHAFEKLIIVLDSMAELDLKFRNRVIFEGGQWDFSLLVERLNRDVATEADRFAFQHCLFLMFYKQGWCITPACRGLLSDQFQRFTEHTQRLGECTRAIFWRRKSEDSLREMLMSDEIAEDTRWELLHHFLLVNFSYATRLVERLYGLENQYFVINPSCSYRLEFYAPPGQPSGDHKEKVRNALLMHGLIYASQRVLNDKELVLAAITKHPEQLQYVNEELRNDTDVVMASVTRDGNQLQYASPELKNNVRVVMAAVEQCPDALRYVSEKMRSNQNIIKIAMANDIQYSEYASESVLSDRDFMLDLIAKNHRAFKYVAFELEQDKDFIEAARHRNPKVIKYIRKLSDKV